MCNLIEQLLSTELFCFADIAVYWIPFWVLSFLINDWKKVFDWLSGHN